jgi:predicted nucleotide-binding protein
MEQYPERYWHVYIKLPATGKSKATEAVVNDLAFADLERDFLRPWQESRPFAVSGIIIRDQASLEAIRVSQTDQPQSAFAAAYDQAMSAKGIWDMATDRHYLPVWQGHDYTQPLLFSHQVKTPASANAAPAAPLRRIFIVHGHDEEMKAASARFVERLELEAVILDEKPGKSRTIIEKFLDYADVQFALVLLSPDDEGKKRESADPLRPRARQNVIFELGFFIGKLGREKVAALYRQDDDFAIPSDFAAVQYVSYDARGTWQFELCKELNAAGYSVDANKLLK